MSVFLNIAIVALSVFVIVYAVYGIIAKVKEIKNRPLMSNTAQ